MQLSIKVQSISDVITNSSSEIFSIRTDMPKKELQSLIEKVHSQFKYNGSWENWVEMSDEEKEKYDISSGMGGILEVKTFDDYYQEYLSYIPENKKHLYTKEVHAIGNKKPLEELEKEISVDIDHGFTHTIDWILENLFVVDCECPVVDYRKKEDEDKIWYSEEEWNNLPEAWIDITMPYGSGYEDCDTFYRAGLEAVLKTHNIPGNYTIDFL